MKTISLLLNPIPMLLLFGYLLNKDMESLPSKDLIAVRHFTQKVSMTAGVEMPDGKKCHLRYIFIHIVLTVAGIMHFNGIYQMWPQFINLSLSFAIFSLIIQLIARLVNRFNLDDEERTQSLKTVVIDFYKQEEMDSNIYPILKSGVKTTKYAIQSYLAISSIIYHIPIIASWIISYRNGVFEMFAHLQLPFTTNENLSDIIINSLSVLISSIYLYLCLMHQDMIFIFHSCQTIPMAEVLIYKLNLLGTDLVNSKEYIEKQHLKIKGLSNKHLRNRQLNKYFVATKTLEDIENKLYQIIKEQESYNSYINQMLKSYQLTSFMALSLNSIALSLSLIAIKFVSIPIGLAVSAMFLFQVLLPCANGHLINNQNQKLLDAVYDFPWYELSAKKRKMYLQFLLVCQHTRRLTLPIIGNVDMELFTEFVEASYSYFMFLTDFVKY